MVRSGVSLALGHWFDSSHRHIHAINDENGLRIFLVVAAQSFVHILEIEGERFEVDAQVDAFDLHAAADAELDGGEVEDGAEAGFDEGVVDLLSAFGGDGDDADLDGVAADDVIELRPRHDRDAAA